MVVWTVSVVPRMIVFLRAVVEVVVVCVVEVVGVVDVVGVVEVVGVDVVELEPDDATYTATPATMIMTSAMPTDRPLLIALL